MSLIGAEQFPHTNEAAQTDSAARRRETRFRAFFAATDWTSAAKRALC